MRKAFRYILWIIITLAVAAAAIIGGFLVYATVNDYKPEGLTEIPAGTRHIGKIQTGMAFSIVSWNIGYGGLDSGMDFFYDGGKGVRPRKGRYARNIISITGFIQDNNSADFWLFQEVDRASKRSYSDDQVIRIRSALPGHTDYFAPNYVVRFVPVPPGNSLGRVNSGLLSMLRPAPENTFRVAFEENYSWPLGLFMPDRCLMIHRFSIAGQEAEFILINTHNSAFDDGTLRKQQLGRLKNIMVDEYRKGNYVIAGGDWNMNPPGFDAGQISVADTVMKISPSINLDYFPDNWNILYDERIPTNRDVSRSYVAGETPVTIIDFFICSPNVEIINIKTFDLKFRHSDHNPVMLTFSL